jgi:hypothetical protein
VGTDVLVLGALLIVLAVLGRIGAMLLVVGFGGVAALMSASASPDHGAAAPLRAEVGLVSASLATVLAIPGLIAGIGLIGCRPWARILPIVLSAIKLLGVPRGTGLGIYGLWVLMSQNTETLFSNRSPRANLA